MTASFRRVVALGLTAFALANVAVAFKLDRLPADWTTTNQTREFLLAHTGVGDRLVLGPPFVLVAATGLHGRDVTRVVPQPYFLDPFDQSAFVRDINSVADAYVGAPEWYRRPVWTLPSMNGLFEAAEVQHFEFRGRPVMVARRRLAAVIE